MKNSPLKDAAVESLLQKKEEYASQDINALIHCVVERQSERAKLLYAEFMKTPVNKGVEHA